MLDNGKWSKENEKLVLEIRGSLVYKALQRGYSVIVDDTNFDPGHEMTLKTIAVRAGAELVVRDFRDVPLEECLRRNRTRRNKVPSGVILDMYNRYIRKENEPEATLKSFEREMPQFYTPDGVPDAVQFDLDGTLALFGDNNPYDRNCLYDKVNYPVFDELRMHQRNGDKILILSGRKGEYLKETDQWLTMNGIKPDLFLMRAIGDKRPDTEVKREMFLNHVAPNYNVRCVYDDRDGIVDTWRDLGLTCFQVAAGNF